MKQWLGWILSVLAKVFFWGGLLFLVLLPLVDGSEQREGLLFLVVLLLLFSITLRWASNRVRGIVPEKMEKAVFVSKLESLAPSDLLASSIERRAELASSASVLTGAATFMLLTVKPIMSITKTVVPAVLNTPLAFCVLYLVYKFLRKAAEQLSGPEINPWLTTLVQIARTSVEHDVYGLDSDNPQKLSSERLLSVFFVFIGVLVLLGGFVHNRVATILLGCGFGLMFAFLGGFGLARVAAYERPQIVLWLLENRDQIRRGFAAVFALAGIAVAAAIVVDQLL